MLNNVSYERMSSMLTELSLQSFNDTAEYLTDNYTELLKEIGNNATEYVLVLNSHTNLFQKTFMFAANYVCDIMHKYNVNISLLITLYIVCFIFTYTMHEMRTEFNARMTDMCDFMEQNETEYYRMINECNEELKRQLSAQNRRITNSLKNLNSEQQKHSSRLEKIMFERIRTHRHEELKNRIYTYLELFEQYAPGDKLNVLFNLSNDIQFVNPSEEGAVIKKYFGKFLVWSNKAKSQILYPLNIAYSPSYYSESTRNIRKYADSLPANTVKELAQFREDVETKFIELFSFPVVKAPNESQQEFEISVFEYLDECLCGCYKTYNIYCNAGLQ